MAHQLDEQRTQAEKRPTRSQDRTLLHNAILFYAVGTMFLLAAGVAWFAAHVLLLVFSCILTAVLLYDISCRVQRWLHLPRGVALAVAVAVLSGLIGAAGWLMAPQIAEQGNELVATVPKLLRHLRTSLESHEFLRGLLGNLPSTEQIASQAASMLPRAGLFFSGVLGAVGNLAIIVFVGIYFAAQPHLYIDGIVTLVPHHKRRRARQVLDELGLTLGQWLLGKAISMVIVGVATAAGLSLLGVPLATVLGLLAGLLDFIPYLGPIMAGAPALLIAFSQSPELALYVALLFVAIQVAEGYLLLPLVERKTVSLPPALTILMQVLLGVLFGLAGVALATPLTAVLAVLIAMLYVQDVLGDPVKTPSEH